VGKNDVIRVQAISTGMPPNQKVNKAKELAYISLNAK
jgi:hypothetical protein